MKKQYIFVCTGKDCKKKGAKTLCSMIKKNKQYKLVKTKCLDVCKKAPNMIVDGALKISVKEQDLKDILDHSLAGS